MAAILFREPKEDNDELRGVTYGGRLGHCKNQPVRDSCSLTLPDPRVPHGNGKGAASAMVARWGLREEGRGTEDTTATQTLTPNSRPTLFPSPWMGRGASGGSASCHSPGPLSRAGVSNKGSFRLASSRRMFTRRSDEKLSPNAVL